MSDNHPHTPVPPYAGRLRRGYRVRYYPHGKDKPPAETIIRGFGRRHHGSPTFYTDNGGAFEYIFCITDVLDKKCRANLRSVGLDPAVPFKIQSPPRAAVSSEDPWENNFIQFPRLIAEIAANCSFSKGDFKALCESMDLEPERVNELFDRAQCEWDTVIKAGGPPRKLTPERDLRAYVSEEQGDKRADGEPRG
jgi:hypothetical protein